jgi:hypothetical protein
MVAGLAVLATAAEASSASSKRSTFSARFNRPARGAWYAGFELKTAVHKRALTCLLFNAFDARQYEPSARRRPSCKDKIARQDPWSSSNE